MWCHDKRLAKAKFGLCLRSNDKHWMNVRTGEYPAGFLELEITFGPKGRAI
jgi:hypothetical protein